MRLQPMEHDDIEAAVALISRAMNPEEGTWAGRTFEHHFACAKLGIEDGRSHFVWLHQDELCGLVGLHHYLWGPDANVWLSWFAVEPALQGRGKGAGLLAEIEKIAISRGFSRLFVETYLHSDFEKARAFYQRRGFSQAGCIGGYLDDGSEMVVYRKGLTQ